MVAFTLRALAVLLLVGGIEPAYAKRAGLEASTAKAPAMAPSPPRRPVAPPAPDDADRKPGEALPAAEISACRKALAALGVPLLPPPDARASGSGARSCAVPDPVTFAQVPLPDGSRIALESPATTRCTFALELVAWLREDLVPILARTGAKPATLAGVGSHECRLRNRQSAGPVSEHASGNALDLRALVLADGRRLELTGADASTKPLREAIRASICARFTTVLGPGSDGFHEDHVHLDLRARNSAYRLCRWRVN